MVWNLNPWLHVIRNRSLKLNGLLRHRVREADRVGVEQLAGDAGGLPEARRMLAIRRIAHHWIPQIRHVDADLMRPPGFEGHLKQRSSQ